MEQNKFLVARNARMVRLDDQIVSLGENPKDEYLISQSLTCGCGDTYNAAMAQITNNRCSDCFYEKEFGILPDSPDSFACVMPDQLPPGRNYFPKGSPSIENAFKAHEESGGVFNVDRKIF